MRYVLGFVLSMLMVGCGGEANGVPCSEQGIRDAIEKGGGPYFFACEGPTTVVTQQEIVIANDVILDGLGNLTVDGNEEHRVFSVPEGVAAELRGLSVRRGSALIGDVLEVYGGGIENSGNLTLTNSTVSENSAASGGGIINGGMLTLINSTVSGNLGYVGGGISSGGTMTLLQSTVSSNDAALGGGGILNYGRMTMTNCTVSRNSGTSGRGIYIDGLEESTLTGSVVDGDCTIAPPATLISNGYNIESPGDTCGFDTNKGDQVSVSAEDLALEPLQDNGGPTETHAPGEGSVAIDVIPAVDCVDADGAPLTTDQRGQPRPGGSMCDVGAFEVQP